MITKWTPHEWEFKQDRLGRGDFETFFFNDFPNKNYGNEVLVEFTSFGLRLHSRINLS